MSKNKIKTDGVDTGLFGKYRKKETASPSASAPSPVIRQPTAVRRAEPSSASSTKNACWSSFPNLPVVNSKTKLTPPQSPNKPRSKSVRMPKPPKKNIATRIHQFLGSHSNLGSSEKTVDVKNGVYTPLRPRSIGGSSDCSSNQSDLSRCDSLRESSRSKVSHTTESVASGVGPGATPLVYYDSFDSPVDTNPSPGQSSAHEFSNLRPISIALPHSTSSVSLTSGMRGGNSKVDLRYYSYAAPGGTDGGVVEDRLAQQRKDRSRMRVHRSQPLVSLDISSPSIADDVSSSTKTSQSVLPSDPEYPMVAQDLMTASPTRKTSLTMLEGKVSGDVDLHQLGAESSHIVSTRTVRSLPTTPVVQTFSFVRQDESSAFITDSEAKGSQDSVGSAHPSPSEPTHTQQQKAAYLNDPQPPDIQGRHQPNQHDSPDIDLPPGWEVVNSSLYGTYFVNHNNRTAQYQPPHQHPHYSRPPSANHRSPRGDEEEVAREGSRKMPLRSYSHRGQDHRVVTSMSSLPRRTKSFRDQEEEPGGDMVDIAHERQISTTMTYVPPSPYQIKEIPPWLRAYIEAPFGTKEDKWHQWEAMSQDDLNCFDTMIKRLLKKGLEQIVKKYDYYRVAVQQEMEERTSQRRNIVDNTAQRKAATNYDRSLQRRAIMNESFPQRGPAMEEGRPSQRRVAVEPSEMNYQPQPLPIPYNQSFPPFQHQLQQPQGQYMQATPPSYLLEPYCTNQRPPYYPPSCLPPGYPNFVVDPETAVSKARVPNLCLEETYV